MSNAGNPLSVIGELLKTIDIIGVDGASKALISARGECLSLEDKEVDFTLMMVKDAFKIKSTEILTNRGRSTAMKLFALKFFIFYLHEIFGFNHVQISPLVDHRDRALLSRYSKEMRLAKENPQSVLQKYFIVFDQKVSEFKKNK